MALHDSVKCQTQADKADLVRHRANLPLEGPILPGQCFEWEPTKPHAAETIVVIRVEPASDDRPNEVIQHQKGTAVIFALTEALIWSRSIDGAHRHWNTEGRFREAVVRSMLKDQTP